MKVSGFVIFLLIYLLILLVAFLLQRKLIYFPAHFSEQQHNRMVAIANLAPWPSVDELYGLISKNPPGNIKGTVLVFHGNAGAAVHRVFYIDALQRLGYRVVIAEYPGYGTREGSPSEKQLTEDGINTAQRVSREFEQPLFLCGESLGAGVVAGIVASQAVPVKGLILITSFDSMTRVGRDYYWFLLPDWLLLDRFENVANLSAFTGNIAVLLADHDEVVPRRRTMALFDALATRKKLWRFNARHNTLPLESWRPWWAEVMQFIDS